MNAVNETIWAQLQGAVSPQKTFRLQTADELASLPPLRWRVRDIFPESGLACVYGPSGSGKSFLVLDMATAIASGRKWFNAKTTPCPVIYIALEGEHGIGQRLQALRTRYEENLNGCHFLTQPMSLLERDDITALVEAIREAGASEGMVIIDTLNRAAPGADENSSVDMGRIIEAAKRVQMALGGLVLLVHHSGKDSTRGLRGHSSLHAALDCCIEVSREGDHRAWRLAKSKDGLDGEKYPFKLDVVELGVDSDGFVLSSCVVVQDITTDKINDVKMPQGTNQKLVLNALRLLLLASTHCGKPGAPSLSPCIEREAAITAGAAALGCESFRRVTRANEAINGLINRGILGFSDGWLWLR